MTTTCYMLPPLRTPQHNTILGTLKNQRKVPVKLWFISNDYQIMNQPELWSSSSWFPKISSFPIRGFARLVIIELSVAKIRIIKIKFIFDWSKQKFFAVLYLSTSVNKCIINITIIFEQLFHWSCKNPNHTVRNHSKQTFVKIQLQRIDPSLTSISILITQWWSTKKRARYSKRMVCLVNKTVIIDCLYPG